MATRKCGIFIFRIFYGRQAAFYEDFFFKELFGLEGSKTSLKISSGAQSEDLEPSLTTQEFFSKKYFWFYMQRMCVYPFWVVSL